MAEKWTGPLEIDAHHHLVFEQTLFMDGGLNTYSMWLQNVLHSSGSRCYLCPQLSTTFGFTFTSSSSQSVGRPGEDQVRHASEWAHTKRTNFQFYSAR